MKQWQRLAWICLSLAIAQPALTASARNDRDQYAVVEASDLARFPQRYWGRGIVFEDTFESFSGRTEQSGGRRFTGIVTRELGRIYVAPRLLELVERMQPGQSYLFAGIVVSETGARIPFMGARTRYWIAVEEIERLVDDVDGDLSSLFDTPDALTSAFEPVQRAVRLSQNLLIGRARSDGVPIEQLFDTEAPRQDAAMHAARTAVRDLTNETGITAAEYLSILVREILARQYEQAPAIEATPRPESQVVAPPPAAQHHPSVPRREESPATDLRSPNLSVDYSPETPEINNGEPERRRGGFIRSRRASRDSE